MKQTCTYPVSALLSDLGGAAGLFLGLNVIGRKLENREQGKPQFILTVLQTLLSYCNKNDGLHGDGF